MISGFLLDVYLRQETKNSKYIEQIMVHDVVYTWITPGKQAQTTTINHHHKRKIQCICLRAFCSDDESSLHRSSYFSSADENKNTSNKIEILLLEERMLRQTLHRDAKLVLINTVKLLSCFQLGQLIFPS